MLSQLNGYEVMTDTSYLNSQPKLTQATNSSTINITESFRELYINAMSLSKGKRQFLEHLYKLSAHLAAQLTYVTLPSVLTTCHCIPQEC